MKQEASFYRNMLATLVLVALALVLSVSANAQSTDYSMTDHSIMVCSNSQRIYTKHNGTTGRWKQVKGKSRIQHPDSTSTLIIGMSVGVNEFVWTATGSKGDTLSERWIIENRSVQADAGYDQILCRDRAKLQADLPKGCFGVWGIETGYGLFVEDSLPNTVVKNLGNGRNVFTWTVSNGYCKDVAQVTMFNDQPVAFAGDDKTVCTDQMRLSAKTSSMATGHWEVVKGSAVIENAKDANSKVKLGKGINILKWKTSANGCSNNDEIVLVNHTITQPTITQSSQTLVTCSSSTILSASQPQIGVQGKWSVVEGNGVIETPNAAYTSVNHIAKGENIFRWTLSQSICHVEANIRVVNNDFDVLTEEIFEPTCQGRTDGMVVVKAISPDVAFSKFNYTWNNGQTSRALRNMGSGNYTVSVTSPQGCVKYKQVELSEPSPLKTKSLFINASDCAAATGSAALLVTGGVQPYQIAWDNGIRALQANNLSARKYAITITDFNKCIDTFYLEVPIRTFSQTEKTIVGMDTVTERDHVYYHTFINNANLLWEVKGGYIEHRSNQGVLVNWFDRVQGEVSVKIVTGCDTIAADKKVVNIRKKARRNNENQNIVTPDGDGNNDYFALSELKTCNGCFPNNELFIYDEWARLVYRTSAYRNDWQGEPDGKQHDIARDGTYYYIFKRDVTDAQPISGSFELRRSRYFHR